MLGMECQAFTATDTRWSRQKNGSESTTSWIDVRTGKILMYANVIKDGRRNANVITGASNMMESQGMRKCLSNMNDDHSISQITSISRDIDNKIWYILEEYEFNKYTERFDPGHYRKNFDNRWSNFIGQYKNIKYTED